MEGIPKRPFIGADGKVRDTRLARMMAEESDELPNPGNPNTFEEKKLLEWTALQDYLGHEIPQSEVPPAVMETFRTSIWETEHVGRSLDEDKDARVVIRCSKEDLNESINKVAYRMEYTYTKPDGSRKALDLKCLVDKNGKPNHAEAQQTRNAFIQGDSQTEK